MKGMHDSSDAIGLIVGVIMTMALIYGMYWLMKHGSYWWWYEDLVKGTIKEMVDPQYLKHLPIK